MTHPEHLAELKEAAEAGQLKLHANGDFYTEKHDGFFVETKRVGNFFALLQQNAELRAERDQRETRSQTQHQFDLETDVETLQDMLADAAMKSMDDGVYIDALRAQLAEAQAAKETLVKALEPFGAIASTIDYYPVLQQLDTISCDIRAANVYAARDALRAAADWKTESGEG